MFVQIFFAKKLKFFLDAVEKNFASLKYCRIFAREN